MLGNSAQPRDRFYNGQMEKNLTSQEINNLNNLLKSKRKSIETIIKHYTYKDALSYTENIKVLVSCLENILEIQSLENFELFLSNEDNIPIEISIKNLKPENIQQLFHDWLHKKQDSSNFDFERVYTVHFRNFLFKKILDQEKQNIDEYFETISPNKKVKGCDLYQLFIDILSQYYLYEFHHDRETFFEKINSFNRFEEIVDQFTNNEKRIFVKDKSKKDDEKYIRRYQFEKLIQFWEIISPELQVRTQVRKNIVDSGVQTHRAKENNKETQTHHEKNVQLSCLQVINRTLRDLNIISERQNDSDILQSIERLHTCMRKQKIFLSYLEENTRHKHRTEKNLSPRLLTKGKQSMTPPKKYLSESPEFQEKKLIKYIYNSLKKGSQLSLNELQIFFYDVGLIEVYQNHLIYNIMNSGMVKGQDRITCDEFINIIRQLMIESPELSFSKLQSYANSFDVPQSPKNVNLLNPSISGQLKLYQRRITPKKERNKKLISKTTYQIDSEDSFV